MRQPTFIFILLALIAFQSNGQILSTKDVYKLKSRRYTFLPDSTVYKDSIDINPFKERDNNQITINLDGLEQSYRLDIELNETDTIAYITAYTYEIKSVKPTRKEKKMFPRYRIEEKEEWKLKTKVTPLKDTIINSVLSIIEMVNFDSLPGYETMRNDIGLVQFDGHGFGFKIRRDNYFINYSVNSLYLNRHEKLKELQPIESLLLNYFKTRRELKVDYLTSACYNSGSVVWICQ